MVAVLRGLALAALLAACASEPSSPASGCPSDSQAFGLTLPSGFGVSIGESGLKAAYNAIRDYFTRKPGTASEADKAQAADLAASAAASEAAKPMTDEEKRALRAQAGEWVESYEEKCRR